ncbi:MAG TPA: dinitrogenase iron-molybdenum cofactor biosynthesis protein [Clostridiaceae bacterium]|jgi:predicted Fe-Mo cluster-binding NifX family protein|nr:dinitrogenase iron-molybdenum cofactor biosynthesis protein [Clostridiaceae bacterium]
MKIAIPTDSQSMESTVCASFGRAPYFLIYDTETKDYAFVANTAASGTGGAGIMAAQIVADQKVSALLTPRCGQNAADVFQSADIKLYRTNTDSVKDNIEAFVKGELPLLADFHAGFHGRNRGGR